MVKDTGLEMAVALHCKSKGNGLFYLKNEDLQLNDTITDISCRNVSYGSCRIDHIRNINKTLTS